MCTVRRRPVVCHALRGEKIGERRANEEGRRCSLALRMTRRYCLLGCPAALYGRLHGVRLSLRFGHRAHTQRSHSAGVPRLHVTHSTADPSALLKGCVTGGNARKAGERAGKVSARQGRTAYMLSPAAPRHIDAQRRTFGDTWSLKLRLRPLAVAGVGLWQL